MKRPIRYYGDPILRKKSLPLNSITDEIKELVFDMVETMDGNCGIGLAAVQVGIPIRLFVLRRYIDNPENNLRVSEEWFVYINPKILDYSSSSEIQEEGCLSIPELLLPVERPHAIKVISTDLNGNETVEELSGLNARVVMHENDHLNGVLYIDRVKKENLTPTIKKKLRDLSAKFKPL